MATVGSTVNLCQRGWEVNHKLVYKLMDCNVTPEQPNTVCVSDVTEFLGDWYEGLSFTDHGFKRSEYSGTRVVDIPVNEVDVYFVKECDYVA
ncbi:hypothetical protein CIP107509_00528 [Corynebacterium diphtheriae]|nr:hypothetical protein CIP107509_00528 [Corynebacterium diphtheriae]